MKVLFSKILNIKPNLNEWSYISVEVPLVVNCQQGKQISKEIWKYIIVEATGSGGDVKEMNYKLLRSKLVQRDVSKLVQKKPVQNYKSIVIYIGHEKKTVMNQTRVRWLQYSGELINTE